MLSVKQSAVRLGISPSKMYELVEQKKIAHYRVGGKILLDEQDLDAYLASCRVEAGGRPAQPARSAGVFKQLNAERLAQAWRQHGVE